jgi:hypothetical protein
MGSYQTMSVSKKLLLLLCQCLPVWLLVFSFTQFPGFTSYYSQHIYPTIQESKSIVFRHIPFSVGDVLYIAGGIWLMVTFIRWVYYIGKFGVHKDRLLSSVINAANVVAFGYLFFLLSWGGNYYKEPLAKTWMPAKQAKNRNPDVQLKQYKADVIAFAKYLTGRLQQTQLGYQKSRHTDMNERAIAYYRTYTDCRVKENGQHIKSTLFAPLLLRMGVDGYYNPFTGEGQVNMGQPAFMMPFLMCHEMAHQAGIAAEGDANLMAYALCTKANDVEFQYSAYLNLWLYAYNRLYRLDSVAAKEQEVALPRLTRLQIDTLQEIYRKYQGAMTEYTTDIYDSYLRMQQQEGIKSYGNVVKDAWHYEQWRRRHNGTLHIP